MTFALDTTTNHLIGPTKNVVAICPDCSAPVIARCGFIRKDHWCHLNRSRCGKWHEPETAWHRDWKELVPDSWREVVTGVHRADIQKPDGSVIELQHSPLAGDIIEKREQHYGNMIWLFDFTQHKDRFFITEQLSEFEFEFKWKYSRKAWRAAKSRIFLDLGTTSIDDLFGEWKDFISYKHFKALYTILVRANRLDLPHGTGATGSTILVLDEMTRNGWGKVRAIDREDFITWLQTDQASISSLLPTVQPVQPIPQKPANTENHSTTERAKPYLGLWGTRPFAYT